MVVAVTEKWREGDRKAIWEHCCGFFDLTVEEFLGIQKRLWQEQMTMLVECELGRKFIGDSAPHSLDEFKAKVPLTSYEDYHPYLPERREDVLPCLIKLVLTLLLASSYLLRLIRLFPVILIGMGSVELGFHGAIRP